MPERRITSSTNKHPTDLFNIGLLLPHDHPPVERKKGRKKFRTYSYTRLTVLQMLYVERGTVTSKGNIKHHDRELMLSSLFGRGRCTWCFTFFSSSSSSSFFFRPITDINQNRTSTPHLEIKHATADLPEVDSTLRRHNSIIAKANETHSSIFHNKEGEGVKYKKILLLSPANNAHLIIRLFNTTIHVTADRTTCCLMWFHRRGDGEGEGGGGAATATAANYEEGSFEIK